MRPEKKMKPMCAAAYSASCSPGGVGRTAPYGTTVTLDPPAVKSMAAPPGVLASWKVSAVALRT